MTLPRYPNYKDSGVTISIVRNHKQIATLAPQLHHQSAMEAFGDLYRPMEHTVNDDRMTDTTPVGGCDLMHRVKKGGTNTNFPLKFLLAPPFVPPIPCGSQ